LAFTTRPLDASTWPDFATLVQEHHGVWSGCWCPGFHEDGRTGVHPPEKRRALKEARVRSVSSSFLHNATVAMFERQGFTRTRRIGKHRWVVSRELPAAGWPSEYK
jgi:hypothetical protein